METVNPTKVTDEILAPLLKREGIRHLWLGDTRQGKTYANRVLLGRIIKRKLVDMVLTVDEKDPNSPQYEGHYLANTRHARDAAPSLNPKQTEHIVFRGVAYRRDLKDKVDYTEMSVMSWHLIRLSPITLLLNLDELADATNGHQDWIADETAQIYRKGGGIGLSVLATTQMPQLLPREAFALSETIGIFRMDGREADYLVRYRVITDEMAVVIPTLEVGQWLYFRKGGGGWDGNVYRY